MVEIFSIMKKNKQRIPNKFSQDADEDDEETSKKWYEEFPNDPAESKELSQENIDMLRAEAKRSLDVQVAAFDTKRNSKQSDITWMKTMLLKGTTSDKIAAYTLLIQNSPLNSLSALRSFIAMIKIGKKEGLMVIQVLTELFLSDLLPKNRKLRVFAAAPLSQLDEMCSGNQSTRIKHLTRWYFEDQLKEVYHEFLMCLNTAAKDLIEANKEKAIMAMYKLLCDSPEKESLLLTNLVNKLGDPSDKVASKTIYCMTQILQTHPAMKTVMMEEIEKLIFRPNVNSKTQYYGVCFLSQYVFTSCDSLVARNVIAIYFAFFKACVKKGDVDTRMMRILLIGVNRAFPFISKEDRDQISEHVEMLYKFVHVANYNVSLHALCLVFQVADLSNSISNRFFTALYKKLSDLELSTSSHHAMFLSLIYKALKKNDDVARGKAFIKRLLQVCELMPAALACGILFLVSQLMNLKKNLKAMKIESSKFSDDEDDEEVEKEEKEKLSTWCHVDSDKKGYKLITKYDGIKRDPLYAGGEHCAYTELMSLTLHYHPSVRLFAERLLAGKTIHYSGDPLQDFTLIRFLDRFVFKNPKKATPQPSPFARKKLYSAKGLRSLPVNSNNYLDEIQERIPIEEHYMYTYLQKKREQGIKVNSKEVEANDNDDDLESVGSDDFNEMMDGLMGGKKDLKFDFADDVGDKLTQKEKDKKSKRRTQDKSGDEDDEEGDDDDDEEEDDDEGDGLDDLNDDAEDIQFGDDGDDFQLGDDFNINDISDMSDEDDLMSSKKKKKKMKMTGPDGSIFASADEFAQMLEESGADGLRMAGSDAIMNKDNSGAKQMKWEVGRDKWMTDGKWKRKKQNTSNKPNKRVKKGKRK